MTDNHHPSMAGRSENGSADSEPRPNPAPNDRSDYTLIRDPLYLITVGAFALITTGLPAALGQLRFMPILQAVSLTVFLSLAVRRGNLRAAYKIVGIWVFLQFTTMLALTLLRPIEVQRAIVEGFNHRQQLLEWIYAAASYPSGLATNPLAYLVEFLGVLIGGVATAGLLGVWFLMRLINLTAYSIGTLTPVAQGAFAALIPLLLWHILRIAGYCCLIPLAAMPAHTGKWSPQHYWQTYRRVILIGLGLVLAGLLFEALAAPLWPLLMPEL